MDLITQFLTFLDSFLGSAAYFPYLLLGTGLFFTFYLKFPQVRYFGHVWEVVRGKYDKSTDEGDATHFQALTTTLSGTVDTDNIGGVGLALYLGGPAALFWMLATAFLGMTTKFVEVSMSHKYRVKDEEGFIAGGPMYYMERSLNMKWLAIFFAGVTVISSFGSDNMPQSNSIAQGMLATFGIPTMITGAVLVIAMALVIIGGITRIVKVTEKIVPVMAVIYIVGAFAVIFTHLDQIEPSFLSIFTNAFSGSAPIAHAAAKAHKPISEGMISILEPFIDTLVICTITGLVILSSGVWTQKFENTFQTADMEYIAGVYSDENEQHRQELFKHLDIGNREDNISSYNGNLTIVDGQTAEGNFTLLNSRSVAE